MLRIIFSAQPKGRGGYAPTQAGTNREQMFTFCPPLTYLWLFVVCSQQLRAVRTCGWNITVATWPLVVATWPLVPDLFTVATWPLDRVPGLFTVASWPRCC